MFLTNLTLPNKQFVSEKLFVGLRGKFFNSWTMYKFKIKLIYNEEECTELLNFKFTVSLAKLDMVKKRLVSNGLIFSDDIPVDIQIVTVLFLSNIRELSIKTKTRKF